MEKPQTNKQKAKCKHCDGEIPKGEGIKHSGRYYHEDCYEEWKGKADDRTQLIDYVIKIYNLEKPTGKILQQIKRYHEDPELGFYYTYKGMELTLQYYYELLENKPRVGDGIGIIPYEYDNATRQYIQQMKINEAAQNEDNYKNEERVVYISPRAQQKKNVKMINMDEL